MTATRVLSSDRQAFAEVVEALTSGGNLAGRGKAVAKKALSGDHDEDTALQIIARYRAASSSEAIAKLKNIASWLEKRLGATEAVSSSNPREIAASCASAAADIRKFLANLDTHPNDKKEPTDG